MPIMALQTPGIVFLWPDGSLILVLLPSSMCPTMTAEAPLVLARVPLSPFFASQLETIVPSGSSFTGRILPTESLAIVNYLL